MPIKMQAVLQSNSTRDSQHFYCCQLHTAALQATQLGLTEMFCQMLTSLSSHQHTYTNMRLTTSVQNDSKQP